MPADPVPDLSEDNLIGRSGYGSSQSWRYNFGGYNFMAVAYFARWAGPVAEADDPYGTMTPPAVSTVQKHVQGVVMIPGRTSWNDNALIKRLVRENGALSVGMYWDSSAYSEFTDGTGTIQATHYLKYAWGENHGVDIVGWDDQYPARTSAARTAGRRAPARSSCATAGAPGSATGATSGSPTGTARSRATRASAASAGATPTRASRTRTTTPASTSTTTLGVTDHWGYGAAVAWGAARYTATATQAVSAAGFYTLSSSTRYQVWAGPTLKTLTLRAHGVRELPGYDTVKFSEPLQVTEGRRFVVAIRLYSPGDYHPLAMERPARTWMRGATATRGQSFMSRDGKTWTDVTQRARERQCLPQGLRAVTARRAAPASAPRGRSGSVPSCSTSTAR